MLDISHIILFLHFLMLSILCLFGLHRLSIVLRWITHRKIKAIKPAVFVSLPTITIQVPLYNERLVAERIVHAVAKIDYPKNKLQIQIIDDSTDETSQFVARVIKQYAKLGVDIQHVHRNNREGYKAGALKAAMTSASGEFIAIFDADFIPYPSIIKDTIDHFNNKEIAMVQFRWDHLNRHDSQLTQSQAMMLDAHFSLEQHVRYASNALFNFNGTAGIWRTKAIVDAGNWSADTLTEDLDLSYRAQLKGWKLIYLNDVGCPGELPANMNAFKSQQHRWAKGGIQVMKKMLLNVWRSTLSLPKKLESTFHLSNNLAYFVMLFDTIFLLVPSLIVRHYYQLELMLWVELILFMLASGGHLVYFFFGQVALGHSKWRALKNMPRIILLGIQLAFNNSKAVLEAILGQQSEFVRTPKSGDYKLKSMANTFPKKLGKGLYKTVSPQGGSVELFLAIIYSIVLIWSIYHELWLMLPFLLLLIIGFFSAAIETLKIRYRPSCQ